MYSNYLKKSLLTIVLLVLTISNSANAIEGPVPPCKYIKVEKSTIIPRTKITVKVKYLVEKLYRYDLSRWQYCVTDTYACFSAPAKISGRASSRLQHLKRSSWILDWRGPVIKKTKSTKNTGWFRTYTNLNNPSFKVFKAGAKIRIGNTYDLYYGKRKIHGGITAAFICGKND
ncbi:MAG: hypothetical protein C4562_03935 [Actinobacteria bacterium]|nr:MAG: hypothetical protein C4562_03935 [Actinomycetota bacterium]